MKQWISSTKSINHFQYLFNSVAFSKIFLKSALQLFVAERNSTSSLLFSARIFAVVVFQHPAGHHKIIDGIFQLFKILVIIPFLSNKCSCPTIFETSSGRILSASG
ncbi:MAG: hypothetical protein LBU14_00585 [Candidatus Peribacteria bacterium]|nr:hypothetical protein [Candidatus Peribacteria bacterium]